jgi:hypothetical protein
MEGKGREHNISVPVVSAARQNDTASTPVPISSQLTTQRTNVRQEPDIVTILQMAGLLVKRQK